MKLFKLKLPFGAEHRERVRLRKSRIEHNRYEHVVDLNRRLDDLIRINTAGKIVDKTQLADEIRSLEHQIKGTSDAALIRRYHDLRSGTNTVPLATLLDDQLRPHD